jgi:L-fuculose-phosphate aldolase
MRREAMGSKRERYAKTEPNAGPQAENPDQRGRSAAPLEAGTLSKVEIETLPVTRAFLRRKRLIEDRGELALIEDGMPMHHLGYFSLIPGQGFRGGHFHERKTEHFYVIAGELRLETQDMDTGRRTVIHLKEGQKAVIRPRCAHRFLARETAQVIEYYEGVYDKEDDHPHRFEE